MQNTPSSTSIINVPIGPTSIDVIKSKMDAVLYNAALEGSVGAIEPYRDSLTSQVTPSQNTVLHLHVGVPKSKRAIPKIQFKEKVLEFYNILLLLLLTTWSFYLPILFPFHLYWVVGVRKSKGAIPKIQFIEKVLDYENSLLLQKNDNGEIPLHLAARFGHIEAVKFFIDQANRTSVECPAEILRTTDKNNDTSLHLAARCGNVEIVELLLKADDSCPYDKNNDNETPLYIVAEREHHEVVAMILNLCKSPAFGGPLGRTALHAAVLYMDDRDSSLHLEILHKILKKNRSLLKSKDDEGQTPLHYAASKYVRGDRRYIMSTFNRAPREILTILLEYDDPSDSAVYIRDKKGCTALHLAVMYGGVQRIKPLIEHRSDCSEIRDINGQNLFHYAVTSGVWQTVEYLMSSGIFSKFINEKDKDGNTPLHLLSTSLGYYAPRSYFICMRRFLKDKDVDLMAFNSRNQTAGDIVYSHDTMKIRPNVRNVAAFVNTSAPRGVRTSLEEKPNESQLTKDAENENRRMAGAKKVCEVHIVVATLIATVSFAAGIAVPGGFDQNHGPNQGTALLTRQHAFRAFMVSDSLALTLSAVAIFFHFHTARAGVPNEVKIYFDVSNVATILSLGAMMVAFTTGTYAILYQSTSLAIMILAFPAILACIFAFNFLYLLGLTVADSQWRRTLRVSRTL